MPTLPEETSFERVIELANALKIDDAGRTALLGTRDGPPRTTEEVGFYLGRDDTDQETRYRFMVSLLDRAGRILSAEDKYSHELLFDFTKMFELPPAFTSTFDFLLDESAGAADSGAAFRTALAAKVGAGYVGAMQAVEAAFEARGERLRTLWTAGGDTLHFIAVAPEVADAWTSRPVAYTHRGEPLGLRPPTWGAFYHHLSYAIGLGEDVPPGCELEPWRE